VAAAAPPEDQSLLIDRSHITAASPKAGDHVRADVLVGK